MKRAIVGTLAIFAMSASLNAAVYATVNGIEVTDKDVASLMRTMPGVKFETLQPQQRTKVIDQAIERKLLAKEALKSGIEKDTEYKKTLESIKSDLALEVWMKRVYEKIKVSEADAKAYFEKNSDKFVKPETVKARHIVVKDEETAKKIIKELSGLKAEALTNKFIELAKTKSTGPSGANGGDLGWFNKKQMVEAFSEAAFGQGKGEVTKTPVKTQFGYHVILTEDKKGGEKIKFSDAKVQIENGLKMEKFRKDVAKIAKDLRKKSKIVMK